MTTTIDIRSLNSMFNEFLNNSQEGERFEQYCIDRGYITITDSGYNFSESFKHNKFVDTTRISTDLDKYQSYLSFLSTILNDQNTSDIITNKNAISKTIKDILEEVPMNTDLGLTRAESENLYNTYLSNGKHKMKKMKPKRAFLWKKIGIPTIVTTLICAAFGGIVAASGLVAGAIPLLTDSLALNIASLATVGGLIGAVLTPTIIVLKNKITRYHYAHKYGTKTNNLNLIKNSNISKMADIEKLNLPINELFEIFEAKQDQLLKSKHTKNPFKRLVNRYREKSNRNRLHEIINVLRQTNQQLSVAKDEKSKKNLALFQKYLVSKTKNLELSYRYADIIARSKNDKKAKISDLKVSHKEAVRDLSISALGTTLSEREKHEIERDKYRAMLDPNVATPNAEGSYLPKRMLENKTPSLREQAREIAKKEHEESLKNNAKTSQTNIDGETSSQPKSKTKTVKKQDEVKSDKETTTKTTTRQSKPKDKKQIEPAVQQTSEPSTEATKQEKTDNEQKPIASENTPKPTQTRAKQKPSTQKPVKAQNPKRTDSSTVETNDNQTNDQNLTKQLFQKLKNLEATPQQSSDNTSKTQIDSKIESYAKSYSEGHTNQQTTIRIDGPATIIHTNNQ